MEDFTLKHILRFEICAHEICEKFKQINMYVRNNRIC